METRLLEFPVEGIDILNDEQFLRFNSFPAEYRSNAPGQVIASKMRFAKHDDQRLRRIASEKACHAPSDTKLAPADAALVIPRFAFRAVGRKAKCTGRVETT